MQESASAGDLMNKIKLTGMFIPREDPQLYFKGYKEVLGDSSKLIAFLERFLEYETGEEISENEESIKAKTKKMKENKIRENELLGHNRETKKETNYLQKMNDFETKNEEIKSTGRLDSKEISIINKKTILEDKKTFENNLEELNHTNQAGVNNSKEINNRTNENIQIIIEDPFFQKNEFLEFQVKIRTFLLENIDKFNEKIDGIFGRSCELGLFGISIDIQKAIVYYKIASANQYPMASYYLARCYEFGIGISKNFEKARWMYRTAAKLGYHRAMHRYAKILIKSNEINLGVHMLRAVCRKISKIALNEKPAIVRPFYDLGCIYQSDKYPGVIQDRKYAFETFKTGAALGCDFCRFKVDEFFEEGEFVEKRLSEAFKQYKMAKNLILQGEYKNSHSKTDEVSIFKLLFKASISGLAVAMPKLAQCYINGHGTPKDVLLGLWWLKIAQSEDIFVEDEIFELEDQILDK